ncbi:MAG: Fic family protein [Treponema sp.]|nr:Fic family protein [Treponema sp.]
MHKYDYTYEGTDSYFYPGTTVLKNKLGIYSEEDLAIAEKEITSIKLLMLHNMTILDKFDFEDLCKIHKIIFSEVYDWAGLIRQGDFFSKGSSIFCRGQYITTSARKIFADLFQENYLNGLKKQKFIERMAYYIGEINALHPFREGNGRTLREYFRQLSLNANYTLDFSEIDNNELLQADIEAFNGQYSKLIKILDKAISAKNSSMSAS